MKRCLLPLVALVLTGCGQDGPAESTSDASLARWQLASEPRPEDTTLDLLVQERECASGQSAEGRIAPPDVEYQEEAVIVTVRVRPLSGGADCPDNPGTPYVLNLEEPLGERALLDGSLNTPRAGAIVR